MKPIKFFNIAMVAITASVVLASCGMTIPIGRAPQPQPAQTSYAQPQATQTPQPQAQPTPQPAVQPVTTPPIETEVPITVYCDSSSTKDAIRGTGVGESMGQQVAKRYARQAAMEDVGIKIRTTISTVITDYYKTAKQNLTEDLKERLEGRTDLVVKESISKTRGICEKFTKNGNNYKCYIALEVDIDSVTQQAYTGLTKDEVLQTDFAYEQFKEQYNDALMKYEASRNR